MKCRTNLEKPMSSTMDKQPVDQSERQQEELVLRTRMDRVSQKILVLSGKGGVGKSTVAANLAT